jgi:hypothetical protein
VEAVDGIALINPASLRFVLFRPASSVFHRMARRSSRV